MLNYHLNKKFFFENFFLPWSPLWIFSKIRFWSKTLSRILISKFRYLPKFRQYIRVFISAETVFASHLLPGKFRVSSFFQFSPFDDFRVKTSKSKSENLFCSPDQGLSNKPSFVTFGFTQLPGTGPEQCAGWVHQKKKIFLSLHLFRSKQDCLPSFRSKKQF